MREVRTRRVHAAQGECPDRASRLGRYCVRAFVVCFADTGAKHRLRGSHAGRCFAPSRRRAAPEGLSLCPVVPQRVSADRRRRREASRFAEGKLWGRRKAPDRAFGSALEAYASAPRTGARMRPWDTASTKALAACSKLRKKKNETQHQ